MTIGYLHILYTDGKKETINNVTRVSNLSKKSRYFYYETLYDAHGKGTCIENDKIQCWEFNFKKEI